MVGRDGTAARLLVGTVMHERLRPVRHAFAYPIFQVCCDVERLAEIDAGWFGIDRWAPLALASRDYGPRDGRALGPWMRDVLAHAGIPADGPIWLQTIPRELYEAASLDGAKPWRQFSSITFPLISAFFTINVVLSLKGFLQVFDQIVALTNGGPGTSSRVIGYTFYVEGFQAGLFGKAAAVAVVMMLILIPIMIFNVRRFRAASVV